MAEKPLDEHLKFVYDEMKNMNVEELRELRDAAKALCALIDVRLLEGGDG